MIPPRPDRLPTGPVAPAPAPGPAQDLIADSLHGYRRRFQSRLLTYLIAFSVVCSVGAGSIFYTRQVKFVQADQIKRGRTLVHNLAAQSELGAHAGDRAFLFEPSRKTFFNKDVLYTAVYSLDGNPLLRMVKSGVNEADLGLPISLQQRIRADRSVGTLRQEHSQYDDFITPILAVQTDSEQSLFRTTSYPPEMTVIGIARLGLSHKPAQSKLEEVLLWGIYLAFLVLAMGVLLALLLSRHISRPISALTRGANEIWIGNLGYQLDLQRSDELGLLAESFNRMSSRLQQTVASLAHLNRHLEEEVRRRTMELERRNLELQHQRDRLRETDRLKSQFLANTSHELRTPLNAIIGYTEILSEGVFGQVNTDQQQSLEGISDSAANLLELINQLLDLSKLAAGKMKADLQRVDLDRLVAEVRESMAPFTRNRPYEVSYEPPNGPLEVELDPAKVRQILVNLLSNAIEFTSEGSVTISMEPPSDGEVKIHVKDTGIGVRSEDLATIFEAFRQVDGSSTREHGGTGLGLAISKQFATVMGGDLLAQSTYGEGSCFTLIIPAAEPVQGEEDDV